MQPQNQRGPGIPLSDWNPLTNWNHWRQVEEKVMEDEELWGALVKECSASATRYLEKWSPYEYIMTDLHTRCKALVSVLPTP